MKTENQAWRDLQARAAAQLRPDFADRTLRFAHGPAAADWEQLRTHAAAQMRPGFAARVLRAARALPNKMPSLLDQLAFGAATAALCLAAVLYFHSRSTRLENERNLAGWHQIADEAADLDQTL
jgi:hypothetical protein